MRERRSPGRRLRARVHPVRDAKRQTPFVAATLRELMAAHRFSPPPSLYAEVPIWLRDLLARMLLKEPGQRPASMHDASKVLRKRKAPGLAVASVEAVRALGERVQRRHVVRPSDQNASLLGGKRCSGGGRDRADRRVRADGAAGRCAETRGSSTPPGRAHPSWLRHRRFGEPARIAPAADETFNAQGPLFRAAAGVLPTIGQSGRIGTAKEKSRIGRQRGAPTRLQFGREAQWAATASSTFKRTKPS